METRNLINECARKINRASAYAADKNEERSKAELNRLKLLLQNELPEAEKEAHEVDDFED